LTEPPDRHTDAIPLVDVIIPVYAGATQTRLCIERALSSPSKTPHELVVIDDASPDPDIREYLDRLSSAHLIRLIRHSENQGYTRTINEGIRLHPDRDVVLLNSDTQVASDWLDRLRRCAYAEADIATVNPFSNNATICSYPLFCENNPLPPTNTVEGLDRLFRETNAGRWGEIPTAVGFCMYIKRACLDQVGLFDEEHFPRGYGEENDFCMRASQAGWRHALCGDTFVFHTGSVSFGAAKHALLAKSHQILAELHPEYDARVREHVMRDPNRILRAAVDAARQKTAPKPPAGRRLSTAANAAPYTDALGTHFAPYTVVILNRQPQAGGLSLTLTSATEGAVDGAPIAVVDLAADGHAEALVAATRERAGDGKADQITLHTLPVGAPSDWADVFKLCRERWSGDLLLIESGVELPYAWDARLRRAAKAESGLASASPMCESSPLFSARELDTRETSTESDIDASSLDRLAYALGDRHYYEVPQFCPSCVYLNRDALDHVTDTAEPPAEPSQFLAALARTLRKRGFQHVVCDHLFIGVPNIEGATDTSAAPLAPDERLLRHTHPLGSVRHAIADAVSQGLRIRDLPGLDNRPVQLHLMHSWGGGLEKWVMDYASADQDRINLVLKSAGNGSAYGSRLMLFMDVLDTRPIRTWDLALPIQSTAVANLEYRRILRQILDEFNVDKVLISSLIGHSLDALRTDRQTVLIAHDYFFYCPAIHIYFDGICTSCDGTRLKRCFARNPLNRIVEDYSAEDWLALRASFFDIAAAGELLVVAPSRSVKQHLCTLDARCGKLRFVTIPHGAALEHRTPPDEPAPDPRGRLRIVVLGRLTPEKGLNLFEAVHAQLGEFADIHLLGSGDSGLPFANAPHISVTPAYQPEELPRLLREIDPHLGLLLSVWPETFSYTLSELMAHGIPPVATDTGSFTDRIVEGSNGFLVSATDPAALVSRLSELAAKPRALQQVRKRLANSQHRSLSEMIADYHHHIPANPQPAARYTLQIGQQTGLTEPYRKLTEAYNRLSSAFAARQDAIEQTRRAYDRRTTQVEQLTEQVETLKHELAEKTAAADDLSQEVATLSSELRRHQETNANRPDTEKSMFDPNNHTFARTRPDTLKSPWWIGHIPFAFELIKRLRPQSIVELGTYSGSSFFAFCQAVELLGLPTKCYGIDLWEGDIHMGQFEESLFQEISGYVESRHPNSAVLVRKLFDDAAQDFAPGSVDLLHIDGTHTFEAVSNDFHTWLPKMSSRGVVLFHDTNVTTEMVGKAAEHFGVREFFDSVKDRYPHMEFLHCYGLGVLLVGTEVPESVSALARESQDPAFFAYYKQLGDALSQRFAQEEAAGKEDSRMHHAGNEPVSRLRNLFSDWKHRFKRIGST